MIEIKYIEELEAMEQILDIHHVGYGSKFIENIAVKYIEDKQITQQVEIIPCVNVRHVVEREYERN